MLLDRRARDRNAFQELAAAHHRATADLRSTQSELAVCRADVAYMTVFFKRLSGQLSKVASAFGMPNRLNYHLERERDFPIRIDRATWQEARRDHACMSLPEQAHEMMRLLSVRAIRDTVDCMVHCRVSIDNRQVGYAVSETALALSDAAQVAELIGPEITRMLAAELTAARPAPARPATWHGDRDRPGY